LGWYWSSSHERDHDVASLADRTAEDEPIVAPIVAEAIEPNAIDVVNNDIMEWIVDEVVKDEPECIVRSILKSLADKVVSDKLQDGNSNGKFGGFRSKRVSMRLRQRPTTSQQTPPQPQPDRPVLDLPTPEG